MHSEFQIHYSFLFCLSIEKLGYSLLDGCGPFITLFYYLYLKINIAFGRENKKMFKLLIHDLNLKIIKGI